MPDKVIDIPSVGQIAFPDSMTEAQINAAATKLYQDANPGKKQPPVTSWTQTATNIGETLQGAARSALRGAVSAAPMIGGIVGGLAGAAGGPAGAIAGAALGGAAGEGYRQAGKALEGEPVTTSEAGAVGRMAGQAALQGGAEGVGVALGAVAKPAAERIMQGALKPGIRNMLPQFLKGNPIEAPQVVQTLLKEGVSVTRGGLEKLNTLLDATNDQIKAAIANVPAEINPFKVASRLTPVAKRVGQQVNPVSDLDAVSRVGQEFIESHGATDIPVQAAQTMKQETYRALAGKYGELKGAEVEAQKALARGLKEEIATEVAKTGTDINALNARDGALIAARDVTARRVAMASNRDPLGLASLAVSHPLTFLTVLADRSPGFKSAIARGLYSSAGAMTKVSPQVIRAAVQAVASGGPDSTDEGQR